MGAHQKEKTRSNKSNNASFVLNIQDKQVKIEKAQALRYKKEKVMGSIHIATGELELRHKCTCSCFYCINCEVTKDYDYCKDLFLSELSDYWQSWLQRVLSKLLLWRGEKQCTIRS